MITNVMIYDDSCGYKLKLNKLQFYCTVQFTTKNCNRISMGGGANWVKTAFIQCTEAKHTKFLGSYAPVLTTEIKKSFIVQKSVAKTLEY